MRELEIAGDFTTRLALLEELKTRLFGAVWDYYCLTQNVPITLDFMAEIWQYKKEVLANRS